MDLLTLSVLVAQAVAPVSLPDPVPGPVQPQRFVMLPALPPARTAPPIVPAADTVFEYSAAYYRRLDVHRAGSYLMLPLFAAQMIAGNQLYRQSAYAPSWAKTTHRVAATGVAAVFVVNSVTGVMNLYEGRRDPDERGRKVFHALMMLAADAGFTATGILAEQAEGSADDRRLHRSVAYGSVAVATVGYLSMLDIFRRD